MTENAPVLLDETYDKEVLSWMDQIQIGNEEAIRAPISVQMAYYYWHNAQVYQGSLYFPPGTLPHTDYVQHLLRKALAEIRSEAEEQGVSCSDLRLLDAQEFALLAVQGRDIHVGAEFPPPSLEYTAPGLSLLTVPGGKGNA